VPNVRGGHPSKRTLATTAVVAGLACMGGLAVRRNSKRNTDEQEVGPQPQESP
jgi:hypothetical protein